MAEAPTEAYVGAEIAGYRIEERIGRGGMGVVYRASQLRLSRRVAIKIIAPDLAETPGFRERFEQEARVAASLHHPSIVAVYDAGEEDGLLWLAMQLVEGADLASVLGEQVRLSAPRALDVCGQLAAALDAAHRAGLVHRDVKPANVLLAGERAYLSDFGLTRVAAGSGAMLTRAGEIVGSLHYCAPEQIEGRGVDARADVYALGGTLYHCLTGEVPFPRESDVAVMYAQLNEPVPRISRLRPDLPPGLDAVVARAMEKSAERRFESCVELVEAAAAVLAEAGPLTEHPPHAHRVVGPAGDAEDVGTLLGRRVAAGGDEPEVGTVVAGAARVNRTAEAPRVLLAGLTSSTTGVLRVTLGPGTEIHEADDQAATIATAREVRPDVVVLDWGAAVGARHAALRALRADPVTRSVKVLLLVDWGDADRNDIARAGADATLGLPFSSLQLRITLRKLLGRDALPG